MSLTNYTPWPMFSFRRDQSDGTRVRVLVAQATFAIEPGRPLRALPEQEGVFLRARMRQGRDNVSLVARDDALATFKPKTDVHVDATARAPGGRPQTHWPVRVRVGELTQDLEVRGEHAWVHRTALGWKRAAPAPALEVPMTYDRAFGGSLCVDGHLVEEERNPLGTGFLPRGMPTRDPVPAPQIVALDEPAHRPGKTYVPRGLAPQPPYFEPRCSRTGTHDEAWRANQWPLIPHDFDYAHFNSAHPDLVYPGYAAGDETIQLVHIVPERDALECTLPGWRVFVRLIRRGRWLCLPAHLDTIHLDLDHPTLEACRAYLTWRAVFPSGLADAAELRMVRVGEPHGLGEERNSHGRA